MRKKFKIYWRQQNKITRLCRRLQKWCDMTFDFKGLIYRHDKIIGYKTYDDKGNWCLIIK